MANWLDMQDGKWVNTEYESITIDGRKVRQLTCPVKLVEEIRCYGTPNARCVQWIVIFEFIDDELRWMDELHRKCWDGVQGEVFVEVKGETGTAKGSITHAGKCAWPGAPCAWLCNVSGEGAMEKTTPTRSES